MTQYSPTSTTTVNSRTNGAGAAAILAAAIGCFVLAVLAFTGDKSVAIKAHLNFYKPTGPLSGVTDLALLVWFVSWILLGASWGKKNVALAPICVVSFVLLGLSFLLTFPPIVDLL